MFVYVFINHAHCRSHPSRFIEEPTAPDDVLGHLHIRQSLHAPTTPSGPVIQVASGEHAHSRILFKQLLKSRAIDVCQIDSCRLAGVSEVLSVLLMAAKEGILVCPHAGGVGLCEMVVHLRCVDDYAFSLFLSALKEMSFTDFS